MIGTPYFLAPEVIEEDSGGYSCPADIWSLGILRVVLSYYLQSHILTASSLSFFFLFLLLLFCRYHRDRDGRDSPSALRPASHARTLQHTHAAPTHIEGPVRVVLGPTRLPREVPYQRPSGASHRRSPLLLCFVVFYLLVL